MFAADIAMHVRAPDGIRWGSLSATLCIERSFVENNKSCFVFADAVNSDTVFNDGKNLAACIKICITAKFCFSNIRKVC